MEGFKFKNVEIYTNNDYDSMIYYDNKTSKDDKSDQDHVPKPKNKRENKAQSKIKKAGKNKSN